MARCRHPIAALLAAAVLAAGCAGPTPPLPTTETTTPGGTTLPGTTTLPGPDSEVIPVRMGVTASVAYGIALVLADRGTGLAAANGLDVTVEVMPDQAAALAGALAGDLDVVFPDGPAALTALGEGACLRAPLVFLERDVMRLVAASDIIAPDDLIGRKVGTVPGGPGEVALRIWLTGEDIPWDQVRLVPVRPEDMAASLTAGEVDAIVWSEPVPGEALAACGEEACRYVDMDGAYREIVPLSVGCGWYGTYRDEGMARLVQAWLEAKEYARNNRQEAAAITAGRLHLTTDEVAGLWSARGWPEAWAADLTDDQLAMLEAYGGYLVETGALDEAPDLCGWVGSRWLREVAPELVDVESSAC